MADLSYVVRPITIWPGKPTTNPKLDNFKAKHSDTLRLLARELGHLNAKNVVIQISVGEDDIRQDGQLRANAWPSKPGIILSWESKYGPLCYPCDTFNNWQANLRAVALSLEHLRAVDRYGVSGRGQQYTGWKALPAPNHVPGDEIVDHAGVWAFLGRILERPTDKLTAEEALRAAEMATHPDKGGAPDNFKRVQKCRAILLGVDRA